jgi:hypothetical protein
MDFPNAHEGLRTNKIGKTQSHSDLGIEKEKE